MWAGPGPTITLALVLAVTWAMELKPTAPPIFTGRPFVVAWDVPTQDCGPRLKVPLDLNAFDVQASPNEGFVNQNITIFYRDRLGLYPRFDSAGRSVHGGVPQNGSLWAHLKMLRKGVEHYIRTQEPAGLAVIDWEDWRPVWNWESYTGRCPDVEVARNHQLAWLWAESTALFPSVYLDETLNSSTHGRNFVSFRVREALRVAHTHHANHALPVYVFTRPTYSRRLTGLSEMDLISTIGESAALGAAGVILWGDAGYTTSTETCQYLKDYLTQLLVPYVVNVSWATQYCSWAQCHGHGRCVRRNPSSNTYLHLSANSFRLVPGHSPGDPQLRPVGELSWADLDHLQTHFRCQCYLGWGGDQCQWDHRRAAGGASRAWAASHLTSLLALAALAFIWTL
ncbi:hyaluronidase-2 isoform X2 [Carlito syrichta]|uniref:Hyaluronidase n=1 Tax=Carlito syrichta TaxID=1868482 RepID=A0A1U7T1F6_CARSF|nr:hyaluronidase-2 isoform X2 [Carlito syrichta]